MTDHIDGYYSKRLEDISLLNNAIEIYGQIFVPVGGKRVVGSAYFYRESQAKYAYDMLSNTNGFENLTISLIDISTNKKWWELDWGKKPDNWKTLSKKERGRLFGYKESVLFN